MFLATAVCVVSIAPVLWRGFGLYRVEQTTRYRAFLIAGYALYWSPVVVPPRAGLG